MSLSDVDRQLLQRCLDDHPRAWRDFVDRFLGMVIHVVNHTSTGRGLQIDTATRDDLVADVFLTFLQDDQAVLRRFRRHCSLVTYLTVIARRVALRRLNEMVRRDQLPRDLHRDAVVNRRDESQERFDDRDELEHLLKRLAPREADVVRMFHLEGKSYTEISRSVGLSENSIGPMLARARARLRET